MYAIFGRTNLYSHLFEFHNEQSLFRFRLTQCNAYKNTTLPSKPKCCDALYYSSPPTAPTVEEYKLAF
jgi:hypothetical protein